MPQFPFASPLAARPAPAHAGPSSAWLWDPWLDVGSDLLMALAFLVAPFLVMAALRRREDKGAWPFGGAFIAFGAACGLSLAAAAWRARRPELGLHRWMQAAAALLAWSAFFVIWRAAARVVASPARVGEGDVDDRPTGAVARKGWEAAARDQASRLRSILDNLGDGVITVDEAGIIEHWNPAASRIFGYAAAEGHGRDIHALLAPEGPARGKDPVGTRARSASPGSFLGWEGEAQGRRKDGSVFPVELSVSGFRDGDRAYHTVIVRDASARRKAEVDLRESEARLSLTQTAASLAAWDWDFATGKVVYSGQVVEIFGRWPRNYEEWLRGVHPDDLEGFRAAVEKAIRMKEMVDLEYRYVMPTGEVRWLVSRGLLIGPGNQRGERMLGVSFDITEKRKSAELRIAKEAADNANREKSRFLAHMSHEIRTPLGAILGCADILASRQLADGEQGKYVDVIKRSGRALAQLIDDILDVAKVEAGKITVEPLACRLDDLLQDVAAMMGVIAQERSIAFVLDADAGLPALIVTDPLRLRQILVNVVGNALKFTEKGEVRLRVAMDAGPQDRPLLAFRCTDTGPGIPPANQAKLFHPFSQADGSVARLHGGTGLGLVLARNLARHLGGDVVLSWSEVGKGSTFTVTIDPVLAKREGAVADAAPGSARAPRPAESTRQATDLAPDESAAQALAGMRILLADDSEENRLIIGFFLGSAGARVVEAGDGREAVAKALGEPVDAVLMDLQMPEMDGFAALAELRKSGVTAPVAALTAHAMAEEKRKSLAAGFDAHVVKPVNKDELVATVAALVRHARARAAGQGGTAQGSPAAARDGARESHHPRRDDDATPHA